MTAEFAWGSIRELTGFLRDGQASALEHLEGQLARINRVDAAVHAIATQPPPAFP